MSWGSYTTTMQATPFFGFTLEGETHHLRPFYYVDHHPISAVIKGLGIGLLAKGALDLLSMTGVTKTLYNFLDHALEQVPVLSPLCKAVGSENLIKGTITVGAVYYKFATRKKPYIFPGTDPSFLTNLKQIPGNWDKVGRYRGRG